MINILALVSSIAIAGIAAWYSIIGLMAIFAASAVPIAIMGGVLEVGKLVTASWLYQNWKTTPLMMKSYLTASVVVLMLITSMGIFGFLARAHIEQSVVGGDNKLEIQLLDLEISQEQRRIDDATKVISQLDQAVQTLINFDRIRGPQGSIAVRESQRAERESLTRIIYEASEGIKRGRTKQKTLERQQLKIEAEVGPIRYVAALIYDDANKENIEHAVRWVMILIIFVFDPLAVLLLIAANQGLTLKDKKGYNVKRKRRGVVELANKDIHKMKV